MRGLPCAWLLALVVAACQAAWSVEPPEAVLRRFFAEFKRHRYEQAYSLLSGAAQRSVPYRQFLGRSRDIFAAQMVEVRVIERSSHLTRFHVQGRLRLVYQGELYSALYDGHANMTIDHGKWRIGEVQLKPIQQKHLGKPPPDYHI